MFGIEYAVLIGTDGYFYNGKSYDGLRFAPVAGNIPKTSSAGQPDHIDWADRPNETAVAWAAIGPPTETGERRVMSGATSKVTEVIGRFAARESFTSAVEALIAGGFERADLSVLDSHESLGAAGGSAEAWKDTLAGFAGEVKYLGPLTAAGLILLATGPVGAAVAGVIATGLGGMALYEVFDEIKATPHAREFAKAIENGAVLLWVRAELPERQRIAADILGRHGAADVHVHVREPKPSG